jgi:hypothetical protein
VEKDMQIVKFMTPDDLRKTFDLQRQLRSVDKIFERVFGAHPAGEIGVANKA